KQIAALVLAEPDRRQIRARRRDRGADSARHRHFGQSYGETAIRQVMRGGDKAFRDQIADEIAIGLFARQIDRRRRAFLTAENFAQIDRLAEPTLGFADKEYFFARRAKS